jgi:putative DNA primase/helicase
MYQKISELGEIKLERYRPTRGKIGDILDAMNEWCPVRQEPPTWLDDETHPPAHNLIPFQNGILDVDEYCKGNVVLLPATPAFFSMNILPYNFDPDIRSNTWEEFLSDVFNGNQAKIRLLGEWMGYNCVPDIYYEKMMLFHGPPRSGKSTILEVMREMLGRNQCCETSFQNLCGNFGYSPMVGKLAALIGDAKTPRAREADAALEKILQITGGDSVTIDRKYRDALSSVRLYVRFTMAMNDLPQFTDHVKALEPRLNIIDFENSYVGREDRTLKFRLCEEAKQGKVINFALQGLKRLREQHRFTEPDSSKIMLEQFRIIATPMYEFIDECCEIGDSENHYALKEQLFLLWKVWCRDNGRPYGSKSRFKPKLVAAMPHVQEKQIRHNEGRPYVYMGLRITESAKLQYLT